MNKIPVLIILMSFLFSCGGNIKTMETMEIQVADKTITVEIADTDSLRAQGLMHREKLEQDKGMLFIFEDERKLSFWMKNTLIPLSIAYISKNGEIKEIFDMEPLNESSVGSTRSVLYALEMNRGWFEKNGIKAGDRILIPQNY